MFMNRGLSLPLISIEDSKFFHGVISGEQIYAAAKEFVR